MITNSCLPVLHSRHGVCGTTLYHIVQKCLLRLAMLIIFFNFQFSIFNICRAQRHTVYADDIGMVKVVAGTRWQEVPIITLGGNEKVHISFDQLSHEYHRYTYSVVHLDKDWHETENLTSTDYIRGFRSGLTIEDCEESIGTTQNYTHYQLQLPNRDCNLTMSGNYRVDIYDDNENDNKNDGKVLSVYFLVNEDIINVGLNVTGDTDIDVRRSHQQVTVKADYSPLKATNPREQITGYVMQNYRWDNIVKLPNPTSINQQYMEWRHCRDLIYDGGNEYHKFEILDIHRNSLNVENNTWDRTTETWHTWVWPDYRRTAYVYDEVPKGAFYIRNSDNSENDITSEYVIAHFTLQTEEPFPYPVYIDGMWRVVNENDNDNGNRYRMKYSQEQRAYTCEIPLKYGYYSYQYICQRPDGTTVTPPTEGSFYETHNIYTTLFYYRGILDRADRLVGVFTLKL